MQLTTPLWLFGSLRSILYSSSMCFFHLFLISSTSSRSLLFCPLFVPIFGQNVPMIFPIFLKRLLVLPLLLFYSSFMHCSLKKAFLSLLAILWNSMFSWRYLSLSPLLFTSLLSSGLPWWLKKVKRLLTLQETRVQSLGQEDPLEKEMATHSSTLAWRIPWTEESGGLQSMGWQRVRHD